MAGGCEVGLSSADDFVTLSVGELKKKIFWAGGSIPSGHLEKADLVQALRDALTDKASRAARAKAAQGNDGKAKGHTLPNSMPKEAPRDFLDIPGGVVPIEHKEVVDLHLLSEDELKVRIKSAGGEFPDGNQELGKFFLVATLRQALKRAAEEPHGSRTLGTGVCGPGKEIIEEPADWDPLEDPGGLSPSELKRRLRSYGEELLRGLSERSEFVNALRDALRTRGPPRKRRRVVDSPAPPPQGIAITEEEMMAQMEEMQAQLDAEAAAAAPAGTAVIAAAPAPPPEEEVSSRPSPSPPPFANGVQTSGAPGVPGGPLAATALAAASRLSAGSSPGALACPVVATTPAAAAASSAERAAARFARRQKPSPVAIEPAKGVGYRATTRIASNLAALHSGANMRRLLSMQAGGTMSLDDEDDDHVAIVPLAATQNLDDDEDEVRCTISPAKATASVAAASNVSPSSNGPLRSSVAAAAAVPLLTVDPGLTWV